MGPQAPQILGRAAGLEDGTTESLLKGWRPNEARQLDVGMAVVTAIRTSYVGERAGWELIVESDMAQHTYEALHEAAKSPGSKLTLRNSGYLAIDSLRIEAGRLAWGHELTPEETPLEAGLGFAVKIDKPGGFLAQDALRSQLAGPITRRCCRFETVPSADGPYIWGGEPILVDGKYSGESVTSGARVPSSTMPPRTMALGYARSHEGVAVDEAWLAERRFEIEVGNRRIEVSPQLLPPRTRK
eukprot:gnl/TRDRNA2_/TRDRNA2_145618_c1_seq1.p1 gnl/TRDRNA2_/TRDRNA2_145618_c1~~gnl/TRDRNA2_/TRDRNA2_145618_c1_seq1.p1  ORF type:complete len:243 (+),score=37.30 gnl/TRDRNA2_/TRDRNA2_145618_c1_seq1:2-730(+)